MPSLQFVSDFVLLCIWLWHANVTEVEIIIRNGLLLYHTQQFQIFHSFSHHIFFQRCIRYLLLHNELPQIIAVEINKHLLPKVVSKDQNTRAPQLGGSESGFLSRFPSSRRPGLQSSQSSTQAREFTSKLTHRVVGRPWFLATWSSPQGLTTWQLAFHQKKRKDKRASHNRCST